MKKKMKKQELIKTTPIPDNKLRISPYAWAKICFMRDYGNTEVGGFAITDPDDLMYIRDFYLIKQECTSVTCEFDDQSVVNYMEECIDQGLDPKTFSRIWLHTHPNMSPNPSSVDEDTFGRSFGSYDWAIMMIVSTNDSVFAALQFNKDIKTRILLDKKIDYSLEFEGSDMQIWEEEYFENVSEKVYKLPKSSSNIVKSNFKDNEKLDILNHSYPLSDEEDRYLYTDTGYCRPEDDSFYNEGYDDGYYEGYDDALEAYNISSNSKE